MTNSVVKEIIIVRSLTESDLGLFAAHRPHIQSKQRALNINAVFAHHLLSDRILESSDGEYIPCRVIFGELEQTSPRHFGKIGKNWRLGGRKIDGDEFLSLDSRDFALIRSLEKNDGASLITILFVSRHSQRLKHARIDQVVYPTIKDSMELFMEGSAGFDELAALFPSTKVSEIAATGHPMQVREPVRKAPSFAPMPRDPVHTKRDRTVREKLQSPGVFEQMMKVSSDLSAPARAELFQTMEDMASQLRKVLLLSGRILSIEKNHPEAWKAVKGQPIGFVDGGLANLVALGSAPIAARVGGYIVRPGDTSPERERFITLKKLINELYSGADNGVYDGRFPDISALRDAARISIEAAGAVRLLEEEPSLRYLFLHGALVNPVSRYTDKMQDGQPLFRFPDFSPAALEELLPGSPVPSGREANFISVYLRQLQTLQDSDASVCGIIEREATTTSVIRSMLNSLDDAVIADALPMPPAQWKEWFRGIINPAEEGDDFGQRITDSLLFRCVLEAGEALAPVEINRNELRRAPEAWKDVIVHYPAPMVSYLQPTAWNSPIRLEIFDKDVKKFAQIARLVMHSCLLLPRYAFPAGLDIVDRFAKIPDWMSKPINTNTAVQALKQAMNKGDERLFDNLRRMLCGSDREWMLRPRL